MGYLRFIIYFFVFSHCNYAIGLSPRYSAIVIDANTGRVLEEEGADKICHPASLTKMMTLYIIFDALKMGKISTNTKVPVSAHAARQIPCKLGLRPGETVTVETIIKGMITKSANDASAAIAEYLSGSEANFATLMTRKAKSLGMRHTIFKNSSGVPNVHQVTTARDMAILSRALYLHFPEDYRHFRLQSFHHRGQTHRNHNHLLGKIPGLDGIKTGWVAASGFNLAASAVRKGPDKKPRRLIAVVLGGPNRHWRDRRIAHLLESNFERLHLGREASREEIDEEDDEVDAFLKEATAKKNTLRVKGPLAPVRWPAPSKKPAYLHNQEKDHLWGIQLGTYQSLKEARLKAQKTLATLKTGEISTPKVSKGKNLFFGARLLKLSKEEAETVCRKQGKDCRILASK